jgi:hypothetical protein
MTQMARGTVGFKWVLSFRAVSIECLLDIEKKRKNGSAPQDFQVVKLELTNRTESR